MIVKSVKPRSRTLPDLLDEIAAREPGREFIVGAAERLSYGETRARAREVAKGLHAFGVRRGDKVAQRPMIKPWMGT